MKRLLFSAASFVVRRAIKNTPTHLSPRPDAPRFAHRGAFAVGTREFVIKHKDRPLELTMWYPAALSDDKEPAEYVNGPIKFGGQAYRDAKPFVEEAPYPLLIFSHGSGGTRVQSLFFTEHLASHGFIVMAVDHPGNTVFDSILDPNRYEENRIRNYIQRPHDILRQIDFAEYLNGYDKDLQGIIDLNRVAVSGHSFGGYAAFAAAGARFNFDALNVWCSDPVNEEIEANARGKVCYLRHHVELFAEDFDYETIPTGLWDSIGDSRIKAVVGLAPWNAPIFGEDGLNEVKVPTMLIVGSADRTTVPERDAYRFYDFVGSPTKALVTLQNAGHFIYVDSCTDIQHQFDLFEICSDNVWDMTRAHDIINHMTTSFLRATFYQDENAKQALRKDRVNFVGVTYQTSGF